MQGRRSPRTRLEEHCSVGGMALEAACNSSSPLDPDLATFVLVLCYHLVVTCHHLEHSELFLEELKFQLSEASHGFCCAVPVLINHV